MNMLSSEGIFFKENEEENQKEQHQSFHRRPQAKQAMEPFKMPAFSEEGVNLTHGCNGTCFPAMPATSADLGQENVTRMNREL